MQSEDPFETTQTLLEKSHALPSFVSFVLYFDGEWSTVRLIMSHVTLLFKNKSIEYLQNLVDSKIKTVHEHLHWNPGLCIKTFAWFIHRNSYSSECFLFFSFPRCFWHEQILQTVGFVETATSRGGGTGLSHGFRARLVLEHIWHKNGNVYFFSSFLFFPVCILVAWSEHCQTKNKKNKSKRR